MDRANDRLGSQAALHGYLSSTAAFGSNPAVHEADFQNSNLNDCFTQKRSFKSTKIDENDRPLSATSGQCGDLSVAFLGFVKFARVFI